MNHWYLVASLPGLRLGAEPPLSPGAFRALCGEHVRDDELRELDAVLDASAPWAERGTSAFAAAWRALGARIQDECTAVRAARLGIDAGPWRTDLGVPDVALATSVRDAMQQPDARSREFALDALRWRLLEELAQATPFGTSALLSYGLRLQIAARWAERTEAQGRERLAEHLAAMLAAFDRAAQERLP